MSDDRSNGSPTTADLIERLRQKAEAAQIQLSEVYAQLEQSGLQPPSGVLDHLQNIQSRTRGLDRQAKETDMELGRLRALADTTALINSTRDTDSVLEQVMDTVIQLTGAERGYIVLKNRETGEFDQFRVARGIDQQALTGKDDADESPSDGQRALIVSQTIVNEVASTGTAVLTDNASQDARYRSQQSVVGFALRSILAVPLKARDEVIGVVYCDNRIMAGLFRPGDLETLEAFSDQAAVAIENARLFEEANQQLDYVTAMRDLMDNVFDSIANGVITVDADGHIMTCNASARHLLNLPDDAQPIGASLNDVLPQVNVSLYEAIRRVREDGKQRLLEMSPKSDDNVGRFWNVIVSSLIEADGRTQGVTIVIDDLTETRQREEQLTELQRYLPGPLVKNFSSIDDANVKGQERTVTVIATDVRGFTSFSEHLPPEKLMEIINQYLSLASDGINLYEGIIDKYMGDAVTGLFNTQLNPQEDHALRAVRAATSIIYDLFALHEVMPEDRRLYYGIGIHTGTAFLGNVGSADRQEFTALGEAVSVAKLLEANAGPGEIIISPATYTAISDYFECEPRPIQKTSPRYPMDTVYQVIGRKKGTHTAQLFIDPELAALLADDDDDS